MCLYVRAHARVKITFVGLSWCCFDTVHSNPASRFICSLILLSSSVYLRVCVLVHTRVNLRAGALYGIHQRFSMVPLPGILLYLYFYTVVIFPRFCFISPFPLLLYITSISVYFRRLVHIVQRNVHRTSLN